ncbi:MAG: transaldolase family protein [Bacteroidota bacterium]
MELYLDSADLKEIETAFQLGYLAGLTTTPTFMHRAGITDIDGTIVKLSQMVPVLQIEALGNTAEEIRDEALRLLDLGLDKTKTVFKIPISLEGTRACHMLRKEDMLVNLHLVYTVQQAYMAMTAGATYVCPLVGRLQDQGQDALGLVAQCVEAVDHYGYPTKVMFSSVRYVEHVRNALNLGVHTITVPWKVMQKLTDNHFTDIGTQQFVEHTRMTTLRVRDIIRPANPIIHTDATILDALVEMSRSGLGAVTLLDGNEAIVGVFTDGDLRRQIETHGKDVLTHSLSELAKKAPYQIEADAALLEASNLFKETKVDTLLVVDKGRPVGMLDIQDLIQ